jgi:hypothetical protein
VRASLCRSLTAGGSLMLCAEHVQGPVTYCVLCMRCAQPKEHLARLATQYNCALLATLQPSR